MDIVSFLLGGTFVLLVSLLVATTREMIKTKNKLNSIIDRLNGTNESVQDLYHKVNHTPLIMEKIEEKIDEFLNCIRDLQESRDLVWESIDCVYKEMEEMEDRIVRNPSSNPPLPYPENPMAPPYPSYPMNPTWIDHTRTRDNTQTRDNTRQDSNRY